MLKIGLTGGIGSGKSTVSKLIEEIGIPIIDADIIAREILTLYPEVLINIRKQFGDIYFDDKGMLKRKELGNFVFNNPKEKLKLEAITLPFIIKEIFLRIKQYNYNDIEMCVIDAPTLIETDLYKSMDVNILVWVDLATQIDRVIKRDNLSLEETKSRISSQMPLEEKKQYVNFIIDNSGSIKQTKEQLDCILPEIYKLEVNK